MNINWNLYKAYKDKDLTAKEVAEKAGMDYFRFKRLVNGQLKKWKPAEKRILSQLLRQPQKHLFKDTIS